MHISLQENELGKLDNNSTKIRYWLVSNQHDFLYVNILLNELYRMNESHHRNGPKIGAELARLHPVQPNAKLETIRPASMLQEHQIILLHDTPRRLSTVSRFPRKPQTSTNNQTPFARWPNHSRHPQPPPPPPPSSVILLNHKSQKKKQQQQQKSFLSPLRGIRAPSLVWNLDGIRQRVFGSLKTRLKSLYF